MTQQTIVPAPQQEAYSAHLARRDALAAQLLALEIEERDLQAGKVRIAFRDGELLLNLHTFVASANDVTGSDALTNVVTYLDENPLLINLGDTRLRSSARHSQAPTAKVPQIRHGFSARLNAVASRIHPMLGWLVGTPLLLIAALIVSLWNASLIASALPHTRDSTPTTTPTPARPTTTSAAWQETNTTLQAQAVRLIVPRVEGQDVPTTAITGGSMPHGDLLAPTTLRIDALNITQTVQRALTQETASNAGVRHKSGSCRRMLANSYITVRSQAKRGQCG